MDSPQEQNQAPALEPTGLAEMATSLRRAPLSSDPVAEPVAVALVNAVDPDPPVSNSTEPIKITEIFRPRPMLTAQQRNDEIMAELAKTRAANEPVNKGPQPVAPRITEQTLREMAAGKAQSERHAAARAAQAPRLPSAAEVQAAGTTTPVYRPQHVPGMNSKSDVQRGVRNL